jgi:hypothetical protein
MIIGCGDAADDIAIIWAGCGSAAIGADSGPALEWVANVNNAGETATVDVRMGWCATDGLAGSDPFATALEHLQFRKRTTDTNWQAYSYNVTTGETFVDTGVAALGVSFQRFRLEYRAANVSDDATEKALFLINGAVVATITTNLPPSGTVLKECFGTKRVTVGVSAVSMSVGPVVLGSNMFLNAF